MKFGVLVFLCLLMMTKAAQSSFDPSQECVDRIDKAYSAHYEKIAELAAGNEPDLISDLEQIKAACGTQVYEATTTSIGHLIFGSAKPSKSEDLCVLDIYRAYSYKLSSFMKEQGIEESDLEKLLEALRTSEYCDNRVIYAFLNKIKAPLKHSGQP